MKLIEHTNTIEKIGDIQHETSFKMKSSRKAFQILSDLYSDKPLAIVRELGCNANDSHVQAGLTDKPFHIHLPNTLEPWLTIQDFGTGITPENIHKIYCVYFESTKTNTDDQIGCLGLGSKSPFCYTDNFTITSITDGMKRIYNAYFNEQNTPAIAMMNEEATTEGNGLAIQIPIKATDFYTFTEATKKAFRFFKNKPSVSGGKIDWKLETPMFEGEGWASYNGFGYMECYAIMGGVTYPIEINKLNNKYNDMCRKGGLVIDFEMGQIDFTPSRESLSYCDDTIKALNDKMEFIISDFQKRLSEMLAEKETIFDAVKMVHVLQNQFSYIQGMTNKNLVWRGIDIANPVEFIRKIVNPTHSDYNCTTYYKPSYYRVKIHESVNPEMGKDTTWYYDDMDKGAITLVRNYVRENVDKKITLFTSKGRQSLIDKGFPLSCFTPVSTLPKPISKARKARIASAVQRVKGEFNIYEIGDTDKVTWNAEVYDSAQHTPKYYIIKGSDWKFSFKVKGFDNDVDNKHRLLNTMRFMGLQHNEVVMVSERNVKNLPKTCKEFTKYVNESIDLTYDKNGLTDANCYNSHLFEKAVKGLTSLADDNPLKVYVNTIHNNLTKYDKFRHLRGLVANQKDGKLTKIKTDNEALKILADNIGKYGWDIEAIVILAKNLK